MLALRQDDDRGSALTLARREAPAARPRRWSELYSKISEVLTDPSGASVVWRALDDDAVQNLADPLGKVPFIAELAQEAENEEEKLFLQQIKSVISVPGEDNAVKTAQRALWRLAKPEDEKELIGHIVSFHGSRGYSAAGKSTRASNALSMLFNERRSLLLALDRIMSQDRVSDLREALVDQGMIVNACSQAERITERINSLMISLEQRDALRPQLQIACLIWERKMLLRICFLASIGNDLTRRDVVALMKTSNFLSKHRVSNTNTERLFGGQNAVAIMASPVERMVDWFVWERSHEIDAIALALASLVTTLLHIPFNQVGDALNEFQPIVEGSTEVSWENMGVKALLTLAAAMRDELESNEKASFLKDAFDNRGLKFLRCLLRCAEVRDEVGSILSYLSDVFLDLVDRTIELVCANPASHNQSVIRQHSQSFGTVDFDDDNDDASLNQFLTSRTDPRRNQADDSDSLEDLIECLIMLLPLAPAEYPRRFFTKGTPQDGFLRQVCNARADRQSYFNLLRVLASSGTNFELVNQAAASIDKEIIIREAVQFVLDYRDGLVDAAYVPELCARLNFVAALVRHVDEPTKQLAMRLTMIERPDFVLTAFAIIAHPGLVNEALKTALMNLMASLAFCGVQNNVVVESWKRFLVFPNLEKVVAQSSDPRIDLRSHLNQIESNAHSYVFTASVLRFAESLVLQQGDSTDLVPLLQFVIEDVFFHYNERLYSHPGERWLICVYCLNVLLAAVENCKDSRGAGYMVMGYFLRESPFFTKLLSVLRDVGSGKGAAGLADILIVARRLPAFEAGAANRNANIRPDWFLAWRSKEKSDDGLEQINSASQASSFGPLLHIAAREGDRTRVSPTGAGRKGDVVAMKILTEWLKTSDSLPTDEHPFLWDDGDPGCKNRLLSAKLVLRLLDAFTRFQDKFIAWNRTMPTNALPLRVETLILSQSHLFVDFISGFIGLRADAECRRLALELIDRAAISSLNKEEQVFAWTQSASFISCISSPEGGEDRSLVFDFLCRHSPALVTRDCVPALVKVAETSPETSKACYEAIRTLTLFSMEERNRLGLSFRGYNIVPSSLPQSLLSRYLDAAMNVAKDIPSEFVMGLSWTFRLVEASGTNTTFLFHRDRDRTALFERVLSVMIRAVKGMDSDASVHAIQSWRRLVETNAPMMGDPLEPAMELLRKVAETPKTSSAASHELSIAALMLIQYLFKNESQFAASLTSRDEMFSLVSACVDSSIVAFNKGSVQAFATVCSALLLVTAQTRKSHRPEARIDKDTWSAMQGIASGVLGDVLSVQTRSEAFMDACLFVMSDTKTTSASSRAIAAVTLTEILSFSPSAIDSWVDVASRRGVLQSVILSTITPLFDPVKDVYRLPAFLDKCAEESIQPTFLMLTKLAGRSSRDTQAVITDCLGVVWRQPSALFTEERSPLRQTLRQEQDMAFKRTSVVVALLRLVVALAEKEKRFGLRFLRQHKQGAMASLTSFQNKEEDVLEAFYWTALLTVCASAPGIFAAEFNPLDDVELVEAASSAMCQGIGLLRQSSSKPKRFEVRLVRSSLSFLTSRATSGPPQQTSIPSRQGEELSALIVLVRLITDGSSEWNQHLRDDDLERALLLLYHRLSRTWNANDHLKDLKQLFPRVVGGAPLPSALERLAEVDRGLINQLCTKLAELRFR